MTITEFMILPRHEQVEALLMAIVRDADNKMLIQRGMIERVDRGERVEITRDRDYRQLLWVNATECGWRDVVLED